MTLRTDRSVYLVLVAATCAMLLVLPFVTTFDEFLTASTRQLGLINPILSLATPEARAVVAILGWLGIPAQAAGPQMYIWDANGQRQALLISTTCIGWQSLILLGLSFTVGLRGRFTTEARVQAVAIGVLGTIFVNLIRMTLVALVAVHFGFWPAVLFHDYGGTLLIVVWLFGYWVAMKRWILVDPASDELEMA